jgi:hypothetical protein
MSDEIEAFFELRERMKCDLDISEEASNLIKKIKE